MHSGAQVSLGGGDPLQLRDIAGEGAWEEFATAPRQHKVAELAEDVDFIAIASMASMSSNSSCVRMYVVEAKRESEFPS